MASYGVRTKMKPEKVLKRAAAFFGPSGLGLQVIQQTEEYVLLQGGGGHVAVGALPVEDEGSAVEIETREWDYQVRRFISQIG
ncbi:MAG: hypothetical protein H5T69_07400 [Chloroflexi bacterium]|nr:hypothetical protein [Chloroflexota bacterium]